MKLEDSLSINQIGNMNMINKVVEVKDTSRYWYYHDEQDKVWWFFKGFKKTNSIDEFYKKYDKLTKKFQILNPVNDLFDNEKEVNKISNLSFFYKRENKKLVFPTCLFTKEQGFIKDKMIVDVNELYELSDIVKHSEDYSYDEPLIIVEFGRKHNDSNINDIYIYT